MSDTHLQDDAQQHQEDSPHAAHEGGLHAPQAGVNARVAFCTNGLVGVESGVHFAGIWFYAHGSTNAHGIADNGGRTGPVRDGAVEGRGVVRYVSRACRRRCAVIHVSRSRHNTPCVGVIPVAAACRADHILRGCVVAKRTRPVLGVGPDRGRKGRVGDGALRQKQLGNAAHQVRPVPEISHVVEVILIAVARP